MPTSYTVVFTAPNGSLYTTVELEPDRQFQPEELIVQRNVPVRTDESGRVLTVTCVQLPSEPEFRTLAARAATRAAQVGNDGQSLINALIPF